MWEWIWPKATSNGFIFHTSFPGRWLAGQPHSLAALASVAQSAEEAPVAHLLHQWRVARRLLQTQHRVGRKTPFAALFAVAPAPPHGDRPKPALKAPPVIARQTTQWLMT
jgi:hypothetical protein